MRKKLIFSVIATFSAFVAIVFSACFSSSRTTNAVGYESEGTNFEVVFPDVANGIYRSSFFFLPSLLLALLVAAETDAHPSLFRSFLATNLLTQTTGKSDEHWVSGSTDFFFFIKF